MATLDEARRIALALPGATREGVVGLAALAGPGQGLRLGTAAAQGATSPPWATTRRPARSSRVRVADLGEKDALVAAEPEVFFTVPHFDGFPAVLVRLAAIDVAELTEVITDAWLDRAPKTLRETFLRAGAGRPEPDASRVNGA